jgi:hypothetical protein
VQAVGGQLVGRDVAAGRAVPGGLADQRGDERVQVRVSLGDVLAGVQQRGPVAAVAALADLGRVGPQDRFQPGGRLRRLADVRQATEVRGDVPLVPGEQDRLDVREVLVERGAADAALPGDLGHGHAGQPVLGDQHGGGVEGRVADRVAVRLDRLAPDPRHATDRTS